MKTDRRQHLQDIYSTNTESDEQAQPAPNRGMTEHQKDLRRQQITTVLIGFLLLGLVIGLTFVGFQWQNSFRDNQTAVDDISTRALPKNVQSTTEDNDWVLDYNSFFADPSWDGEGKRPFSTLWIKKAAYNLHWAEIYAKQAKNDKTALKPASTHYEQALEIFPEMEGIKIPLGEVYLQMERYDDAIALLETVPEEKLTPSVLNSMGYAFIQAEKFEQAESCLIQALKKKPSDIDTMKNLATLYRDQNIPQKAIDAHEKYLATQETDNNTRHAYALYLLQIKNWKLAAEQLRILTAELPGEPINYKLLAESEKQLGNTSAANVALERYIQLSGISEN